MKVAAFTSLTSSYLPNGRIIAKSFKKFHPNMDFVLLFNDRTPSFIDWDQEPFDYVVFSEWLKTGRPWHRWAYGYSVIEHCTATKGLAAEYLMDVMGYDLVVYLDPDCQVFSRLDEIFDLIDSGDADVILTPHITDHESTPYGIWSHEIAALKHGTFNLGFFVVANRPDGRKYLNWWAQRLVDYSHIDFVTGTFTDQKWANLAPYIFDKVTVLTDRSYNVATWNLTGRKLTKSKGRGWLINDRPLRFYHFSGFGHDFAWADSELANFARDEPDLVALWDEYKNVYNQNRLTQPAPAWHWGIYKSGAPISQRERKALQSSTAIHPYQR